MMLRKRNLNVEKEEPEKGLIKNKSSNAPAQVLKKRTSNNKVNELEKKTHKKQDVITLEPDENVDPAPEVDYDKETEQDMTSVALYAKDIFRYYKHRESFFKVNNYLSKQPNVDKSTRATLVDWLVEVQETFELNHETLYLAVKLIDIYLDRMPKVKKENLQERSPPLIDDFIYISQDSYDRDELLTMEREFLRTVDFDLGAPISYRFLRRFARVTKIEMSTLTLARYILETSLMFLDFCRVSDSLMGAAALLLALRMKKIGDWSPTLQKYSGYKLHQVEPLTWALNHMIIKRKTDYPKLETIYKKYSHEIFFEVALISSLPDAYPSLQPVGPPKDLLL